MKKNLFIAMLLVLLLALCVLSACQVTTCKDSHTWVDVAVTKEATCDTPGEIVQKCKICNATQPVAINPLGHKYGSWSANADGLTHSRVCETDSLHIDTANHEDADSDYVCDVCGFEMEIPVCDHIWGAWTDNGDGTCSRVCTIDSAHTEVGAHIDEDINELCDNCGADLHVCEWLDWESNEDGTHTRVCELDENHTQTENCSGGEADCYNGAYCDYCYEEYTDSLGHDWGEWESNGDGTHGRACSRDDEHYDEEDCDYLESRTPANCDSAEIITYTCSICGDSYIEDGDPALEHNIVKKYIVDNGTLYWTETCTNDCECSFVDVKNTINSQNYAPVSNAEDLRTVLENGFNARLTEDIELANGPIEIKAGNAKLDLNGHNLTSTGIKQSATTGNMVCDVFIVQGENAKLTIEGDGIILADPSAEALEGVNENDLVVCVLSALDGAYVLIEGGTYRSTGCTTIYACTNSRIDITGGKFIADEEYYGVRYTLDIREDELGIGKNAYINVYGGEFVEFNPENHSNDATYTSKIVNFSSHCIYVEETQSYVVEQHNMVYAESEYGEHDFFSYCEVCGMHVDWKTEFEDGDILTLVDIRSNIDLPGKAMELRLEAVEGEENTFYIYSVYDKKYLIHSDSDESFTTEKTEEGKWLIKGELKEVNGTCYMDIYLGIPGEGYDDEPADLLCLAYCDNHQPRVELTGFGDCTANKTLTLICDNCGKHDVILDIEGGEHSSKTEGTVISPATCDSPEIIQYGCYDCSAQWKEEGQPALGHQYTYTTSGNGVHVVGCSRCDYSEDEFCDDRDPLDDKCDLCSGTFGCNHQWGDWISNEDEKTHSRTCSECGEIETGDHVDVELPTCVCDVCRAEDHDWVYLDVNGKCVPTCTKAEGTPCPSIGSFDHIDEDVDCICDRGCGAKVHDYTATVTEPTCIKGGYTTYECNKCKYSYVGDETVRIPCVPKYVDLGDGTCQEICYWECPKYPDIPPQSHIDGNNDCKCDHCGATSHTFVKTIFDATCEEVGYTLFACKNCEENYTAEEIEPIGHKYTVLKAGNGQHKWVCVNDNSHIIEEDCSDKTTVVEPTCMQGGYTEHYCNVCENTYITDKTDKVDCVEAWIDCEDGTCEIGCIYGCNYPTGSPMSHTDGDNDCKCDRCGAEKHNYTATVTEPTCIEGGYTNYQCNNCEEWYIDDETVRIPCVPKYVDLGDGTCQEICYWECPKYPDIPPQSHTDEEDSDGKCDRCGVEFVCEHSIDCAERLGYVANSDMGVNSLASQYECTKCGTVVHKLHTFEDGPIPVANEYEIKTALEAGYDVVLEADIELSEQIGTISIFDTLSKPAGNKIVIDMASYNFIGDGIGELLNIVSIAEEKLVVELTAEPGDGYCYSNEYPIANVSGAKLVINGGLYKSTITDMFYLSEIGELIINDGYFMIWQHPSFSEYRVADDEEGVVTISGGKFTGYNPVVYIDTEVYHSVIVGYDSDIEGDIYEVAKHAYEEIVTKPTCESEGYTTYVCVCEKSYTGNETPIDPNAHELIWIDNQDWATHVLVCEYNYLHDIGEKVYEPHIDENKDGWCDICEGQYPVEVQPVATDFTLSFADKANRTEFSTTSQVWKANGITLTNDKASSTSNVADYAGPVRFYKNSTIAIDCANMVKVVFDCNSSSYATALKGALTGTTYTTSIDSDKVTVEFTSPVDTITITLTGAIWVDSITVTAMRCPEVEDHVDRNSDGTCERCHGHIHNYVEGEYVAPTCTENGYTPYTCECGDSYIVVNNEEDGQATGHIDVEDEDGKCDICGAGMSGDQKQEVTATLTFDNTSKRTVLNDNQQVWVENGITFTNDKASSTSKVADYSNPVRLYKSSSITIEFDGMTKIVFDCNSSSYATALQNSITTGTVTVDGDKVIVELTGPVDSFEISSLSAQVRLDSLTVTALQEVE